MTVNCLLAFQPDFQWLVFSHMSSSEALPHDDVKQMGARVYHKLSQHQRDELRSFLLAAMSAASDESTGLSPMKSIQEGGGKSWKEAVEEATSLAIERRASTQDASLDAADVVQEVLPIAHASVPAAVRRELFLRIKTMIRQQQ